MEIIEDDGEDTEEDANIKYNVLSDSREHEVFYNDSPYLNKNLPPEDQGDTNSIDDDLYNQLEVDKVDYESERMNYYYFKDRFFFEG